MTIKKTNTFKVFIAIAIMLLMIPILFLATKPIRTYANNQNPIDDYEPLTYDIVEDSGNRIWIIPKFPGTLRSENKVYMSTTVKSVIDEWYDGRNPIIQYNYPLINEYKLVVTKDDSVIHTFTNWSENVYEFSIVTHNVNSSSLPIINIESDEFNQEISTTQSYYGFYLERNDGQAPIIGGKTNYLSNVDNPVTIETLKAGLSAHDNIDGNIDSSKFVLVSDDYTANKTKLGTYDVIFKVSDTAGNEARVTVKVHVVDGTKPVITGTKNYTIGYNQTQSLTTVKNNLTATDNYDTTGLLIQLIEDNYTANKNKKGTYSVKYQVTDSSGNSSDIFIVNITVVDTVNPVISGNNNYTAVYTTKQSIDTIKAGLTATDGHDGDVTSSITLKSDGYSSKYNQKGTYQVVFTAKDSSNNSVDYTVNVTVIDNIKPIISGKNSYSQSVATKLSESTIKAGLTATDGYDGELTVQLVTDGYSSNYNKLGSYEIKYRATDSSNNSMDYTVTITTFDDIPPVIYTTDHFINVDGSLNLTLEEIIEHLVRIGSMSASTPQYYTVEATNYLSGKAGDYTVSMVKKDDAPAELKERITLGIKVLEGENLPDPTEDEATNDNNDNSSSDSDKSFGNQFKEFWNTNSVYIVSGIILLIIIVAILRFSGFGKKR